MILDYAAAPKLFNLVLEQQDTLTPQELLREYGMNLGQGEVFYCESPYTAAPFHQHAQPRAADKLRQIVKAYHDSKATECNAHITVPDDQELRPFQKADVEYLVRRGGGLDGDEPGLGKTPTAIAFANEIRAKRVLVICPAAVRMQWVERIREWTTMKGGYHIYPVLTSSRGVDPGAEWTIVSYDLARTEGVGAALAANTYDLLILDEGHALKTPESARTRSIFGDYETGHYRTKYDADKDPPQRVLFNPLATRCGAVLVLTGTPLLNRPREAYTLSRALCWDAIDFLSEDRFTRRFNPTLRREGFRADGTSYTFVEEHVGRFAELQFRMRGNFMTRHSKREVLPQLKLPVYDIVRVLESGPVKAALHAESLLGIDPDNFDPHDIKIMGHIAVVRHQMGLAIAPQVADYVDMLIDGGETKIVVFGWHKDVLDLFCQRFDKYGVLRIDGGVPPGEKRDAVKLQFIKGPAQVLVGNTLAMGVGMDGLQHVANHAVLAEPDWVPSNNVQAIDRLDRFGQLRTVLADLFVAPGSVLEKILANALKKAHNIHRALDRSI